jgi:hypothetical protein
MIVRHRPLLLKRLRRVANVRVKKTLASPSDPSGAAYELLLYVHMVRYERSEEELKLSW